jgi:hypothetical protein
MAELLALPIAIPSSSPSSDVETPLYTSSSVLPTYLIRNDPAAALAKDANVNVVNVQTKLVKAEFVGCMLSSAVSPLVSLLNGSETDDVLMQSSVLRTRHLSGSAASYCKKRRGPSRSSHQRR